MPLTERERETLRGRITAERSRRMSATLAATVHPPRITRELERATSGPDPWRTRCAPGQDHLDAIRTDPLVSGKRRTR